MRLLGTALVAAMLLLTTACGGDDPAPVPPTGPGPNTTKAAAPTNDKTFGPVTSACGVLTPEEVAQAAGSGQLSAEEKADGITKKIQTCRYSASGRIIAQVGISTLEDATMMGGAQALVDLYTTGYGASEPVSGVGAAAKHYTDDVLTDGVVFALTAGRAVRQVTVESDQLPKDKLVALAGQLEERLG